MCCRASYGIVGGLSFAAYSTGFISAGGVIYQLRRKGYKSLPEAINARYGPLATMAFGLAVMYRIIQEVFPHVLSTGSFNIASGTRICAIRAAD